MPPAPKLAVLDTTICSAITVSWRWNKLAPIKAALGNVCIKVRARSK
jgi:hypothetical protein